MTKDSAASYRERLWPSPGLLIALLLILPAVFMVMTPLEPALALPIAIAVYVLITGSLLLMAPIVQIKDGVLTAGNSKVPANVLGEVQVLDDAALRRTIGPGADARAYLLVRGFIHKGLRIELIDSEDPTPYWVLTSRRPQQFAQAIDAAKAEVGA